MSQENNKPKAECFGINWQTTTPAEVANVNVNAVDRNGSAPLHWAAMWSKDPDVTNVLIKNGANVNAENVFSYMPLHLAAESNKNPEIINALIKNGADVSAKNGNAGSAALHSVAKYNENPDVVNTLIKNGADVNARDYHGWTPLHFAASFNKNPDVINTLIDNGADVNARGGNPFIVPPLAKWNENSNANSKELFSYTPLHFAAGLNKNTYVIYALIKNGADVNARSKHNWTPLHYAAFRNKNFYIVYALIRNGADVNATIDGGETALDLGKRNLYRTAAYGALKQAMDAQKKQ